MSDTLHQSPHAKGRGRTKPAFKSILDTERLTLKITRSAYDAIRNSIGDQKAETGGILGGNRETGIISHFHFDAEASRGEAFYTPDCDTLNTLLDQVWNPKGVRLMGFVHSHPPCTRRPSGADHDYVKQLLRDNRSMQVFFLPLVMTVPDTGRFELLAFVGTRVDNDAVDICATTIEIVDDGKISVNRLEIPQALTNSLPDLEETFVRVSSLYDLPRMSTSRMVSIGTGGSTGLLVDAARSGVGEFVLIDHDTVSATNLATQQVYRRDIGRPKVDCVRDALMDINPKARVTTFQCRESELDDATFRRLLFEGIHGGKAPTQVLLCGFTDSFFAQARVNALSLHFGVPSLCAQLYKGGAMLEVTYVMPGLTRACHRCILASRYQAYLHEGFVNDVGSEGSPVFATGRINALTGFLAMGLLHYQPDEERISDAGRYWSGIISELDQRNLAWVRTSPAVAGPFAQVFAGAAKESNLCFDETIWRPQTPDGPITGRPTCPDCGGTGNLLNSKGTFDDTRKIRREPTILVSKEALA
jgi:proteasome lid subunit RPN8/RPN11